MTHRSNAPNGPIQGGLWHLPDRMEIQGYKLHSLKVTYRWVDALAMCSARGPEGWVVCFYVAPSLEAALLGLVQSLLAEDVKWRPDQWKNDKEG